ncbi:MAG: hypothetical protein COA88_15420 [Kordia sp.]|nr:MAG: hypothetical protein COA88_15420 [Kordia sp.]
MENQFFDAVAGASITMMVFQVTDDSGASTTGEITLIKNSDPLLDAIKNVELFSITGQRVQYIENTTDFIDMSGL